MSRKTLQVLTLNCWALPSDYLPCKFRSERIAALGKELAKGKYDIVLLQEIWLQSDFEKLVNATINVLKYSHYFHSGMFGSGLCVFSKYPIAETFQRKFSLNGYPHRVYHGDWFGGKAVGLAQILVDEFKVNVYVTHTHAGYTSTVFDEYMHQRILQSYELSQFIKHTSYNCDAVIVGGDFNFMAEDVGVKMVVSNGNLLDSWVSQVNKPGDDEESWTSGAKERIDFLMYRNNAGYDMVCDKCRTCMKQVPGAEYNYSDHLGVEATFQIRKNITGLAPERDDASFKEQIPKAQELLDKGLKKVYRDQKIYYTIAAVCVVVLILSANMVLPYGLNFVLAIYRTMGTLLAGYALINGIILCNVELNGIIATKKDLDRLASYPPVHSR